MSTILYTIPQANNLFSLEIIMDLIVNTFRWGCIKNCIYFGCLGPTIWCFIGVSNHFWKTSEVTRTFVGNLVVSFLTFLYSIFLTSISLTFKKQSLLYLSWSKAKWRIRFVSCSLFAFTEKAHLQCLIDCMLVPK